MKTPMKGISQQIIKKAAVALNQLNQSVQTLLETEERLALAPETQEPSQQQFPDDQGLTGEPGSFVNVPEVQQAQTSIHLAEATQWRRRYEAAVRASNQVLYDYDVQANLSTWEGDAARILGYSTTELGSNGVEFWLSLIHPDDRPRFAAAVELILTQAQPLRRLEYRLRRKDGRYIWIQDNNEILLDEAGKPVQVIGFIADITDRKQTELEQQQLLKRLSDLEFALDQAVIVAITDSQGRITQVNDRFCEISQYSREELLGNTHKLVNSSYHPPSFFQNLWKTISSGQIWKGEIKNRAKDGSEYWVDTVIVPFLDGQGQPFQYLAIRFEITERKQAEAALSQSEERNRAILSAVPDILAVIGADGTYQNFSQNQFSGEVLVPEQQSILGLQIADVLPPEWAAAKLAAIQETLSSGELQVYEQQLCFGDRVQYEEVRVVPYQEDTVLSMVRNVSDRKQAELALSESQQLIQQIADSSPNVIYIYDIVQQRNIYINREVATFLGYTSDEVMTRVDQSLATLMHPDDLAQAMRHFEQFATLPDGTICEFEYRMRHKDGEWRWFSSRDTVFKRDASGRVAQILGNAQDITRRKQAEQDLQNSRAFLDAIINAISDPIFVKDAQHQWVLGNSAFCELVGMSNEEFAGKTDYDFFPPEQASFFWNNDETVLTTGIENFSEEVGNHAVLGLRTVATKKTRFQDAAGNLFVVGYARDVTEQKRTEAEIREKQQQLAAIAANIPGGVFRFVYHADGRLSCPFVSEGYRALFGIDPADLQANPKLSLSMVHSEDLPHYTEAAANAITGQSSAFQQEVRYLLPTGEMKWIATTAQLYREANGDVIVDGIDIDITYRKQIEQEIFRVRDLREAIFNESADALFLVDSDTLLTLDCNDRAVEMFEADSKDSLLNIEGHILQRSQFTAEELEDIAQEINTQSFWSREIEYVTLQGKPFWGNIAAKQITVAGRKLNLARVTDISDRKQSEAALQESERQYRRIVETANEGIWIIDTENKTSFVNPKMAEMLGYSVDEMLGKPMFDFMDEAGQTIAAQNAERRKQGTTEQHDFKFQHKNGTDVWTLISANPILDQAGNYIGALGMITDISDRKRAEVALRQSEATNRALIAAMPDLLIRMDAEGRYELINTQSLHFLAPKQIRPNQTIHDVLPENVVEQRLNYARLALETGNIQIYEQTLEIHGQPCYEEVRLVPLLGQETLCIIRDVTDRKRIEAEREQAKFALQQLNEELEQRVQHRTQALQTAYQQLRDSEARFQTFMDNSPTASWITDDRGVMIYASQTYYRLFQLSTADILGKSVFELYPGDIAQQFFNSLQTVYRTGEVLEAIEVAPRPDGTLGQFLVYKFPITDSSGAALIAGVATDITEHMQAEQALRQSEQRYQTLAAAVPVGIYRTDIDGQCLYVNERWCQIAGLTPAEASGTGWVSAIHPDDRALVFQAWNRFVETKTIFRLEYRFQRPDGISTWIFGQAVQELDEDGTVKGYVGTITDISDRKHVEEERQQAEASLQRSERDLRTVFNNVYDAIFIHELDGKIIDCNDRALELYHAPRERILASTVAALAAPDIPADQVASLFQRVANGEALQFEWKDRRLDNGAPFDTEVSLRQVIFGNRPVVIASIRDISDRKRAELALQNSEERFRQLAENVGEVFWLTTLQSKLLYISPVFEQIWGRSPDWLFDPANNLLHTLHPDDHDWVRQRMQAKLDGNYDIEYRILRPDGEVRWIRDRAFLIRNEAGEVYRIGGIAADITERRNTEQLIRDREVRFRSVVESNMLGIGFWDSTRVTYANEALLSMIGYSSEDLQQGLIDWQALTPPEYWQLDQEASLQTQATGACIPYEKEYICKDGTRIPILMGGGHFEGDKQQGAFFVLDIRDRKRAELALRESQQFAQRIADKTPAALYIHDIVNHCNLYSNRLILDLLGYTSTEIQSMGENTMSILLHPDDQPKLVKHHQALSQATDDDDLELEYQMRHANGEWRWFYSRDSVFKRDEQGRVTQYIGAAQDITERKQFEQKLRQINAELERRVEERTLDLQQAMEAAETANRAKSTFLANMSHELRTPLNAILGFAQLMNRDRTLMPDKREQLNIINRSGKHLLNLINDILEMSKIEAGRIQFNPTCFDLYTLLDALEEMFYLRAMEKGLRLTIDRASATPQCIRTDENKLRQVLINLLSNAIKFTQQGSVTLRITAEPIKPHTEQTPDSALDYAGCHEVALTFAVEDTGMGIDPREADAVFEPFIQSEKRQSQEGTGLGLPISRQFVQLMGGNLEVDSTLESGSTFTFTIPVHVADAADAPVSTLSRPILSIAEGQSSYRILVVEDHEANRHLLVQLLQSVGFEVQAAVNGQEAIALWQSWQPHLIWMDMRMPGMDGYTATQQIRAMEAEQGSRGAGEQGSNQPGETPSSTHPPTIIIALTANAFEEERARVMNVGCNDFMRKPFQETELLEKIAGYLNVQYRYAELDEKPLIQANAAFDPIAALRTLPSDRLNQLHQATLELDNAQLTQLVAQIAPDQPILAKLLMEKIENFELQQVFDWLQIVMQGNGE